MKIVLDKTFLNIPRMKRFIDNQYEMGIDVFLKYADPDPVCSITERLSCPCQKYRNTNMSERCTMCQHTLRQNHIGYIDSTSTPYRSTILASLAHALLPVSKLLHLHFVT